MRRTVRRSARGATEAVTDQTARRPRLRRVLRRILGLVLLVAVAAAAGVGVRQLTEHDGTRFEAMFDSTIGLYPGSEVQVLGVPVGTVTDVEPEGSVVRVGMRLDHGQKVAADTKAVIIAPTVVSDRYVQLTRPYDGGTALADGTVIGIEDTAVPVEIDDLYASLEDAAKQLGPEGANKHGALSKLLKVAARNLDGQGEDINTLITEFGKATGAMSDLDENFFSTLGNLKEFNDMLVANDRGVARVNRRFAAVTSYLAADRKDLAKAVRRLGDAMVVVDDFIRENRGKLKTSVENLTGPTEVLVRQKKALEEIVRTVPLVLQNYLNAFDPGTGTLDGRGNLNELTLWSRDGLSARTSPDAPPVMLPRKAGGR